ncbi:TetR family transcriptional regulator [Streptomyces sp. M19]
MPQPPRASRVRDAEATKARLLKAATDEFAAHGIAGARVDRIGMAAKANKALIYAYFGNKDQLFDAVMHAHVSRLIEEVPFDPDDVPGFAGRLFDFLLDHPYQLRLATWHRLERAGSGPESAGLHASVRRAYATSGSEGSARVARSGPGGRRGFAPEDLLTFTLALVSAWMPDSPYAPAGWDRERAGSRRAAVVEAVSRLAAPRPGGR